jgi:hypothetical protein
MIGTLIAESLRVGTTLDRLEIVVRQIRRYAVQNVPDYQAPIWTALEFEADDASAERLAEDLSGVLDEPGWYANFSTRSETFIVYPGRVFRYRRGDAEGRARAQAFGLNLGVPGPQLDWTE